MTFARSLLYLCFLVHNLLIQFAKLRRRTPARRHIHGYAGTGARTGMNPLVIVQHFEKCGDSLRLGIVQHFKISGDNEEHINI